MENNQNLHNKILEIFVEVEKIIKRHDLRYYAIGGTCLGAVRHKGFIPWDDDIDIAMPDKDYQTFLKYAPLELPPFLKVSFPGSRCMFTKVHNIETTFIEEIDIPQPSSYKGVFIDIMPFYGMPKSRIKRNYLILKSRLLCKLDHKKRASIGSNRRLCGKVLWILSFPFNKLVPKNYYYKIWDKVVSKYKYDGADFTAFTWASDLKLILKKEWFQNYVELPFENITIRCPTNWDAYLKLHFGEYMSFPPKEEQSSGHVFFVDLDKPYKYYQNMDIAEIRQLGEEK